MKRRSVALARAKSTLMKRPKLFRHGPERTDQERRAEADKRRAERYEWRKWYGSARWQKIRAIQLNEFPLCRFCAEDGRVTAATECDHVEPHKGNPDKFYAGPFQSLCKSCHARDKQRAERRRG